MAIEHTTVPMPSDYKNKLIVNIVLTVIATLTVALRIVTRRVTGSKLGWDDYFILATVPQAIGMLVCEGLWSTSGIGYEMSRVPKENMTYNLSIFIAFRILYDVCIVTAKLSVLSFYLRVFTRGYVRTATKCVLGLVAVWGLGNILQSLFVCRVYNGTVDFLSAHKCGAVTPSLVFTGIYNCTTNLIINFLPVYTIWSMRKVSVSTRLGLTAVFLLSIFVTVVSVHRIQLLLSTVDEDESYILEGRIAYFSVLECLLSILCHSLPMLLPLYSYWRYRKCYGNEEDEYVSRVGGNCSDECRLLGGITNGLPLETIYAPSKDAVHFEVKVEKGERRDSGGCLERSRNKSTRGSSDGDGWDGESTKGLPAHAGAAGITIETRWVITQESRDSRDESFVGRERSAS